MKSQNSVYAIQTYNGGFINLKDPRPEDIEIVDIAVVLTRMCRFTCHCEIEYSVANHALFVMQQVSEPALRLPALLHDGHEAYVGDQATPFKQLLKDTGLYAGIEEVKRKLDAAIAKRFGFDPELFKHESIRTADQVSLATERRDNLKPSKWLVEGHEPHRRKLEILDDKTIYASFISAFNALTGSNESVIYPAR